MQRIFVNAAIKKALCREAKGDRSWLSKVRPWYGHDYHFHIRMRCPSGATECKGQPDQERRRRLQAVRPRLLVQGFDPASQAGAAPKEPPKPPSGITLAQMPAACKGGAERAGCQASKV